jgi:hypothetical protein
MMQTFVPLVPACSSLQEQGFLACTSRSSGIYPPLFLCSLNIYIYSGRKRFDKVKFDIVNWVRRLLGKCVIKPEQRNRATTNRPHN